LKVKRSRAERSRRTKRARRRPPLKVTADGRGVVSHAGTRLLADMAERSGLGADLSGAFASKLKRSRRHAPGDVLVDLAVTLADGGECVSDLKVLRNQPGLFGEVASQPTAWRVLDSIDEATLAKLQAGRAASRARVWAAGLAPAKITLDFDATPVNVHSDKENAAPTYKRGFGYHPLLVFCDETSEALAGKLRPGGAGANTAADHVELLGAAIAQLPVVTRADDPAAGMEVLVRADTAGATHGFVDAIVAKGFCFSIGLDITEAVRLAILSVPERAWQIPMTQDMADRDGAGVAEITAYLDLSTCRPGRQALGPSAVERTPTSAPSSTCSTPQDGATRCSSPTPPRPTSSTSRPAIVATPESKTTSKRRRTWACCASPPMTSPPTPPGCCSSASPLTSKPGRRPCA